MKTKQKWINQFIIGMWLCLVPPGLLASPENPGSTRPPNVIYILADDLGYGDLGCYGQKHIQTPNLDELARNGMRFTDHYSGSAVCAPSRMTLMTGRHIGHQKMSNQKQVLDAGEVTLGSVMKKAGYATAVIGKWGLSDLKLTTQCTGFPTRQGFDLWYGFISQSKAHSYYPASIWKNGKVIPIPENEAVQIVDNHHVGHENGVYIHDRFTETALGFIDENKDQPFFIYLPYTIPHLDLIVPDDSLEPYSHFEETPFVHAGGKPHYCSQTRPRATYAGMISRMDRDVGQIVARLKELGLYENTLIMFASDNGAACEPSWGGNDPEFFQGNGPLRGGKKDIHEGGIRIPFIAAWPKKIAPESVSGHVSAFWDVLPTLADLVGADRPENVDGISFLPTLLGQPDAQEQHAYLYWSFHGQAIRIGKYKGVMKKRNALQIFDLSQDLHEDEDIVNKVPELASKMRSIMETMSAIRGRREWR